ncbi:MAG: iron-containing alcohol dehydrogenase [Arachnia sp.]
MAVDLSLPGRIIVGAGVSAQVADRVAEFGARRVLVVHGSRADRARRIIDALIESGCEVATAAVPGEPGVDLVTAEVTAARASRCEAVVAVGGGSVIDAGKAIAALATNPGGPLAYLEVVGQGQPLSAAPLRMIAVPTTAGTGSEATRNAVLSVAAERVKVSLRSALMVPDIAIVDPDFLAGAPSGVLAASGLDALTQLIEAFVCVKATAVTDAFVRQGLPRSARSLRPAVLEGPSASQREDLAVASLMSGLALANAGLGVVHGFAGPIGGGFDAPHGAVCGALLPGALRVNLRALRERDPASSAVARFGEIAGILTGEAEASAEDGIEWVQRLRAELGVPRLGAYGIGEADVAALVRKAKVASSTKGNPIVLSDQELADVLVAAL